MDNCGNYDNCIHQTRKTIRHPVDTRSLYRNRVYDNQTANRLCYHDNPVDIMEGFHGNLNFNILLKWAIIIIVIYLIFMLVTKYNKTDNYGLPTSIGGLVSSMNEFSFLNTTT